jgi:hypothetical protein
MNCSEIRREISEMSVDELNAAAFSGHVDSCSSCGQYLKDMLVLSDGLAALVIPHPAGMSAPVKRKAGREKVLTLIAAMLTFLLVCAVAAYVVNTYYAEEPCSTGPGRQLVRDPGPPKTAEPPPNVK